MVRATRATGVSPGVDRPPPVSGVTSARSPGVALAAGRSHEPTAGGPAGPAAPAVVLLPAAGPMGLLGLQRAAGNRALAGLMGLRSVTAGGSPPVVQRDYERPGRAGGVYESERFGGDDSKRERPTYVELPVRSTTTADRGAAPPPLSQFEHGGRTDVPGTPRKPGFDGGHIVGLHIGGEDISENVVPMFKAFNRGVYKNMEDHVKGLSQTLHGAGRAAWITVHCHYEDERADTPYAFDIAVESAAAGSDARVAAWSTFLRQPWDITVVTPLGDDDQKLVRGETDADAVRVAAATQLEQSARFFALPMGQTLSGYIAANRHLPPTVNGMYPDSPARRPYEFLDLLLFAGKLPVGVSPVPRGDFTGEQRRLILQANMARNGGTLKSDDELDPLQDLSEMGDLNFPEIDHIVPKSLGGSNMFSNARVVSWQLNNRDDRVKSLFGVIDMTKRPLPPLSGMGKKDLPVLVQQYVHRVDPPGEFRPAQVWQWGTENFSVMSGQRATTGRTAILVAALRALGNVEQTPGGFRIKRAAV